MNWPTSHDFESWTEHTGATFVSQNQVDFYIDAAKNYISSNEERLRIPLFSKQREEDKNQTETIKWKEEGNKLFQNKQYMRAIDSYAKVLL